ncbi:MAG: hypothetical protein ACHREM_31155 [Polyangiales bacterium]
MMKQLLVVGLLVAAAMACGGIDKNDGNACTQQSDCGSGLVCQPISGRNQDFCCPTPPTSSSQPNCSPPSK